jgi:hypothetical protein
MKSIPERGVVDACNNKAYAVVPHAVSWRYPAKRLVIDTDLTNYDTDPAASQPPTSNGGSATLAR